MALFMKRLYYWISPIVLVFLLSNTAYSQIDNWLDYSLDFTDDFNISDTLNRDVMFDSRNGYYLSPHDTIRMLVVFAELDYTDTTIDPSINWHDHYWDAHSLPIWADSLFAAYDTTDFSYKRVTRYYQYASSNNHIVLGDYLIAPDNGRIFHMTTSNGIVNVSELVSTINNKLQSNIITKNGFSSINDFDQWTSGSPGVEKNKIPNGKWDYVILAIRNSLNPGNPNGHTTTTNVPLLGFDVDKACIICVGDSKNPAHVIRHEYAHTLLGGNDFHTCGGGWADTYNYWIPQTGGWALLGLYGSSLMCWNAWDRYRLGWKGVGNTYDISARCSDGITEVNGDIDFNNGNGVYVLRDFVTTGDALRIKLPFIHENREYPEWIWLENHQGFNNNNVEFDKWQYQEENCVEDFAPGLMAYIQINNNIRESSAWSDVYNNQYADYLNPLTANGFWDRSFLTDTVFNECVSYSWTRPFIRYGENPLTGCGDQSYYSVDIDGNDFLSCNTNDKKYDQLNNWTTISGNDTLTNLFQLGHSSHSFTLNGNKKIGIGTNPSSAPLINMVGQINQYYNAKNLRTTYLNGISIEILEQYANGNIKVRIRFDDVDVDNDVRWCSDSIVLNNIQTNSGYSLNVKAGKTILLDQGLNATRMTNPILFNGQKIFASPTTFTIQPDVKIHLEDDASIILDNSSKLHLRERSSCVIEDGATLEIKSGTVLQLDDCSSLVIKGSGMLIVESGAELRISPTAKFVFQNGSQNMFVESGVIIPNGYIHPANLLATTVSNVVISNNTTWYGVNYIVNGGIEVGSGATLNVTSSVLRFADYDSHVTVKQGGKLIIDGSTLRSDLECSDVWQGIEVWGNKFSHQYPINGHYLQGYLELKNGAAIENALCAVRLYRSNYANTTGGIINATDAVFRNNAKAVEAKNYTNHHPFSNQVKPYNGWFHNCDFIIDGYYPGVETFYKHVDMSNVNGIRFEGCDFSVSPHVNGVSPLCMGIGAYNAGFVVTSYCTSNVNPCPDNCLIRCTFTGFNNGILYIDEGQSSHTFSVNNSVFTNNNRGIFAQNTGYATIVGNEFVIGRDADCGYGVYANGVNGFCIEENEFSPMTGANYATCGIGIFNSVGVNDVYLNSFDGLSIGNFAYGVNHTADLNGPLPQTILGLTYSCNDNAYNDIDFCVMKDNTAGGIAKNQGSASVPAGNTFSGNYLHFYNDGNFSIDYYYNSVGLNETPATAKLYNVTSHSTTNSNSCISHYGNGGIVKSAGEKAELAAVYATSEDAMERYMAAGDIVRSDLNDSIPNMTELRQWLRNMHDIASDRMVVASYIQEGDFTNALALANTLPDVYNLQGNTLSDHNSYMMLLKLYQNLYNSERTVEEMTNEETEMVTEIAEKGYGASQLMAEGILMEISDRYDEPYICPDKPKGGRGNEESNIDLLENEDFMVSISPIPATTWISVDYKLPNDATKATMMIFNSIGNKTMEFELDGALKTKTLDIKDLNAGVYNFIVHCNDNIKTGKFVIVK